MVSLAKLQKQFLMMDFFDTFDLIAIFVLYVIAGYFLWLRFKHNL
jgi:hypothetical protein